MITSLLVLLLAGRSQDFADPGRCRIDFLERAAPLSKVIPRLAGATHLKLAVSEVMRNEVVCIDVHGVAVNDLMDRLAQVTACSWVEDKSGQLHLIPSPSARLAERSAELTFRAKTIDEALHPPKSNIDAEKFAIDTSAALPAFTALLRQIGVDALARVPNDTRVVYSTFPTATQLPLDGSAFAVFAALTAAQNHAADEWEKRFAEIDKQVEAGRQLGKEYEEWIGPIERITRTPAKVSLIVERADSPGTPAPLGLSLIGYDSEGRAIVPSTPSLNWPDANVEGVGGKPIELSPETRRLILLSKLKSLGQDQPAPSTPPEAESEAIKLALDAETFDPLAYGADLLRGLARAKADQLVACVPDELMYLEGLAEAGAATPNAVMSALLGDQEIEVSRSAGWLCVKPRNSAVAEAARMDRKAMACCLSEIQNDAHVKLDRMLELASNGMSSDIDSPFRYRFALVANPEMFSAFYGEDWSMLRLYALLNDIQRLSLSRTRELPFSSLDGEQSALVAHMIYQPHDDSYVELTVDGTQPERIEGRGFADYRSEPTEVAPNGLPSSGYIQLSESDETVVEAGQGTTGLNRHSRIFAMPNSVQVFANRAARTLDPIWAPTLAYKTDHLLIGRKHTMNFRLYLAKEVYREGEIFGYAFPDEKTYNLETVPDDMKKAVSDATDRLKKRPPPRPPNSNSGPPL